MARYDKKQNTTEFIKKEMKKIDLDNLFFIPDKSPREISSCLEIEVQLLSIFIRLKDKKLTKEYFNLSIEDSIILYDFFYHCSAVASHEPRKKFRDIMSLNDLKRLRKKEPFDIHVFLEETEKPTKTCILF